MTGGDATDDALSHSIVDIMGQSNNGTVPSYLTKYIVEARKKHSYVFYCKVNDIDLIYSPLTRRQFKIYETVERMVGPAYDIYDVFSDNIFYPTREIFDDPEFSNNLKAGIDSKIKQILLESSGFHSIEAICEVKNMARETLERGDVEKGMDWFIRKWLPALSLSSLDDLNCFEIMELISGIEFINRESQASFDIKTADPSKTK